MSAVQWLRESTNPTVIPVATAKAVAVGDIVGLASNTLVRAEDEAWDTDLATTQTAFAAKCVGVSDQAKPANVARVYGNSTDNLIRANTCGVFEMDCDSAQYRVGDYVGPAKATGNALLSQKVAASSTAARSIGMVVEDTAASATRVRFRLLPRKLLLSA